MPNARCSQDELCNVTGSQVQPSLALRNERAHNLMPKVAALVCTAYVAAGVALFLTGEAPVITPSTNFHGDKFSVAWAGWKFCGCLYMALVNWGVSLGTASAITMLPYILFDVYAVMDPAHWSPAAYGFILLEALTAVTALAGRLKVGGIINALYVVAGVVLFLTGEAPVLASGTVFLGNSFAVAWAGWKFSGCFFFALLNLGMHGGLSMAAAMVPYVAFDIFALNDSTHWTKLSAGFIVLDGLMGILGALEYVQRPKVKGA